MKFEEFGLKPEILEQVKHMGFTQATPIQEKCIPSIMEGKDVVGQSLTGSGKTAAFGLPIINQLQKGKNAQVLVLTPTRELAQQVKEHLDAFGKILGIYAASVYGGVGFGLQIKNIQRSEIIVATPGRLIDHLNRGSFNLKNVRFVVLDEVDRMLDIGFEKDVNRILSQVPAQRQTVMFSATMPAAVKHIAHKYLINPIHVQAELKVDTSLLKQIAYKVPRERRFSLLLHLLQEKRGTAIVFCRTKRDVDKLTKNLRLNKLSVAAVHGDITQNQRQYAVNDLKEGKLDALIATDVAARGLDIKNVTHVYNYEIPQESDDYTHRVGRTARAGNKGDAITFVTEHDGYAFDVISRQNQIHLEPLPEFPNIVFEKSGGDRRDFGGRRVGGGFGRRDFSSNSSGYGGRDSKSSSGYGGRDSRSSSGYGGRDYRLRSFDHAGPRNDGPRSGSSRNWSSQGAESSSPSLSVGEKSFGNKNFVSRGPRRDGPRSDGPRFSGPRRSFGSTDSSQGRRGFSNNGPRERSFGNKNFGPKNFNSRGPRDNTPRSDSSGDWSSPVKKSFSSESIMGEKKATPKFDHADRKPVHKKTDSFREHSPKSSSSKGKPSFGKPKRFGHTGKPKRRQ